MGKVLLCQFDPMEYFSYMILSSKLNETGIEHEVELITNEYSFIKELSGKFGKFDIIGFYTYNTDYDRIIDLIKNIKKFHNNKTVILGGPHATLFYNKIDYNLVDFVCVGAGEYYFADWIKKEIYKTKLP